MEISDSQLNQRQVSGNKSLAVQCCSGGSTGMNWKKNWFAGKAKSQVSQISIFFKFRLCCFLSLPRNMCFNFSAGTALLLLCRLSLNQLILYSGPDNTKQGSGAAIHHKNIKKKNVNSFCLGRFIMTLQSAVVWNPNNFTFHLWCRLCPAQSGSTLLCVYTWIHGKHCLI